MTAARTILVVEDNPVTRKMVRVALQAEGYEVLESPDAAGALELAATRRPDLILQDIVLPDLNGLQLIQRLRALPAGAETPIVAFTGFLSRLEEAQIAAAGFNDLLVKPVEPSRIVEALRAHLAPRTAAPRQRGCGRRILVVDDDPLQLKFTKLALGQLGFVVQTATNGPEAMEKARKSVPDAFLADVLMPGCDGFQLCAEVRTDEVLAGIPVVLASSFYVDDDDRRLAMKLGANDFVFRTPDLKGVVHALLGALEAPSPPTPEGNLEQLRSEYSARLVRQLERQLELRSNLAQRASLQAAALSVLGTISETLNKQADTEAALQEILTECMDAAGLSRAAIHLVEPDGSWKCRAHAGYAPGAESDLPAFFGHAHLIEDALREGTPFAIPSDRLSGQAAHDFLARAGAAAALVAPITSRGEIMGILVLDSALKSLGGEEWLAFAQAVSCEIGQALALGRSFARLVQSEERYRALVEHSTDVIVLLDADHRIRYAGHSILPTLGYGPIDMIRRDIVELVHDDDLEIFQERFRDARRGPGKAIRFEFRVLHRDGSWRCLEAILVNRLAEPAVDAIVVNLRDVTERKLGEAALRTSEDRFRQLADNIKEVFFITETTTGRSVYASPAYEEIFGRSLESVYSKPGAWLEAVHPDDREWLRAAASTPEPSTATFRIVRPDGSMRWIRSRVFPAYGPSGATDRIVGIAEDITELRSTEEQLRHAQKMEAIGRLAGGVAHDFNNLLTAIMGYSEMALKDLRPGDPLRERLEGIKQAGGRAASLTRQLLAFSRQQVLAPRVLDLGQHVQQLEKMLRRLLGEDVEFAMHLDAGPVRVKADPAQLDQVIVNLAVNARDAMPQGGRLTVETAVVNLGEPLAHDDTVIPAGRYARLTVADTGTGMDLQTRARIFEPFFTTKEQGKGTGLGLATVYGIVKQSSGHICVYTEPGQGTTFKIYLPTVESPLKDRDPPPESQIRGGSETLLLVEDEDVVRSLAVAVLKERGYHVLDAANGGEALLMCEAETGPIQLLITDVVMPRLGGPELAQRLTRIHPEMRVLYVSGYTERAAAVRIETGAAFLEKPFTPDSLARKVRQVLDEPEACAGSEPRQAAA